MGAKCPERISRSGHLLFALHSAKHQLAVFRIDGNCRTGLDAALQNLLCKQRFHCMLHIPAQRTRAELRIVGRVDDELFCSLRQLTTQLLVGQTAVERRDLQVDDTSALRPFPDRTPLKKQSKKNQRKFHAAKRGTWNGVSPVTRIVQSKRLYDRNRAKQEDRRDED